MNPMAAPGNFFIRLIALIIDALIIGILAIIIEAAVAMLTGIKFPAPTENVFQLLIYTFYAISFYGSKGATPGKLFFNLEVVDFKTGKWVGPWQTIKRE